jgi:hypothetical protein
MSDEKIMAQAHEEKLLEVEQELSKVHGMNPGDVKAHVAKVRDSIGAHFAEFRRS